MEDFCWFISTLVRTHQVAYGIILNCGTFASLTLLLLKRDFAGCALIVLTMLLLVVPAVINNHILR